jgi:Stress responsive A/B Barrel Domain
VPDFRDNRGETARISFFHTAVCLSFVLNLLKKRENISQTGEELTSEAITIMGIFNDFFYEYALSAISYRKNRIFVVIYHYSKPINLMRNIIIVLFIIFSFSSFDNAVKEKPVAKKLLRHVVLFKFKDTSSAADIKKVEDAFRALPAQIKQIKSFEWGTNNSPENLNQGFTHCFFVSFASEKGREVYLPHPAHQAFVEVLKPHLDKVLVIDYWTDK